MLRSSGCAVAGLHPDACWGPGLSPSLPCCPGEGAARGIVPGEVGGGGASGFVVRALVSPQGPWEAQIWRRQSAWVEYCSATSEQPSESLVPSPVK